MVGDYLRVTGGPAAGIDISIDTELLLGRASAGEGQLGGDPELSRQHARIFRTPDGGLAIEDLNSTNGTFVNGAAVAEAQSLRSNDILELGQSTLEVVSALGVLQPTVRRPAIRPAAPTATNSIEVEGLVRDFGDHRAVDGIILQVNPGEIYGFLGPNGAGKSTTVHMLTTLLPPSGGRAWIDGHDLISEPAKVRASIGAALQEAALDPFMNAWEHMTLQTGLQGVPSSERKRRAEELIERVGLTEAAGKRVSTYSGGMKRRLDLALALVHQPRVLFLDEPTTGLDPKSRNDLWEEVGRLSRDEGMTVFLTTQYLEEADQLAHRVGIIERGQIVAEGTPEELKAEIGRPVVEALPYEDRDRPRIESVLAPFGEVSAGAQNGVAVRLKAGVEGIADVVRALDHNGLRVRALNLHAPTLDDVFLAKTGHSLEDQAEEADREREAGLSQVHLPSAAPAQRG